MSPPEEPEFEPDTPAPQMPSTAATAEQSLFGATGAPPNTFFLRFGRIGHIAWQSETSTAVLALIVLSILCVLMLLLVLVSLIRANDGWLQTTFQILGSAISGVAGAIVGASAAGTQKKP